MHRIQLIKRMAGDALDWTLQHAPYLIIGGVFLLVLWFYIVWIPGVGR